MLTPTALAIAKTIKARMITVSVVALSLWDTHSWQQLEAALEELESAGYLSLYSNHTYRVYMKTEKFSTL
jgi:hypothetical protein